jgi:dsRNA-specific ribonuclease
LPGEGEAKSGVPNDSYIDALEALIGAVYLDAGFVKAINSCVDCSKCRDQPQHAGHRERPKDRIARVTAQMNLPIYHRAVARWVPRIKQTTSNAKLKLTWP